MEGMYTEGDKDYDPELAVLFKAPEQQQRSARAKAKAGAGGAPAASSGAGDGAAGATGGDLMARFKRQVESLKANEGAGAQAGAQAGVDEEQT